MVGTILGLGYVSHLPFQYDLAGSHIATIVYFRVAPVFEVSMAEFKNVGHKFKVTIVSINLSESNLFELSFKVLHEYQS